MTRARVALTLYLTVGAWLLFVPAAHAYLDPGSVSVVFGAVIAGAMGAGMFFKTFWRRITGFFRRDDAPAASTTVDDPPAGPTTTSEADPVDADRS